MRTPYAFGWPNLAPKPSLSCPITLSAGWSAGSTAWRPSNRWRRRSTRSSTASRRRAMLLPNLEAPEMKWLLALSALAIPAVAQAEVVSANAHGFEVRHTIQTVIPQAAAFDAFGQISQWWSKDHTYSGDSANMSLSLRPGGCLCERIPEGGGGVEHMHVA